VGLTTTSSKLLLRVIIFPVFAKSKIKRWLSN